MEDFLRDSLGIVGENAMQMVNEKEVCNVSFTSVLASIEKVLNNEETVEDEADIDRLKEGVGESNFQEEGGGCLQNQAMHKNAVEGNGEGGIDSKGVEGHAGEGEEGSIKESAGAKEVEHTKNTSRDSGLSRSGEVSFVENEQEEKVESSEEKNEAVKDNSGVHRNVNVLKDREVLGRDSEVTAKEQSENNDVKNLTLMVKALVASTATTTPGLSVEAVTEDFAWFDCPGLKVTETEEGLQVDVEDRQLGIAAMEGLKHKYSITQQV